MKNKKVFIPTLIVFPLTTCLFVVGCSSLNDDESNQDSGVINIDNELSRVNSLEIKLKKKEYTFDELNEINENTIKENIIGFTTIDNFSYKFIDLIKPEVGSSEKLNNQVIKFKIQIQSLISNEIRDSKEFNLGFTITTKPQNENQEILDKCIKLLSVSCSLTDEEKRNLKPSQASTFQYRNKFSINEDEIKAISNKVGINGFVFDTNYKSHPTSVVLKVPIWIGEQSDLNYIETNVYKEINGFKSEFEIGLLDSQPTINLNQPSGSKSYKGQLEKFTINSISLCSNNQYNDYLRITSWEDVKLNFMYQVRFALYQMFSDNFTEINYYISNEVNGKSFNAIGEGIIKNKVNNVNYGFQYLNNAVGTMRNANLNPGDRIKIQINFETRDGNYKPTLLNRGDALGEFGYSWWWNFDNNCNRFYDRNNLFFVDNLYRDNWMSINRTIKLSISINNVQTYSLIPNQYNSFNFVLKRKAPNN